MERNTERVAAGSRDRKPSRRDRWDEASARIPAIAVVVVAVTAVVTAVMVTQTDRQRVEAQARVIGGSDAAARAQGASPACSDCGVVEWVVALERPAEERTPAYQMLIRMDDGSLRTVEQHGALAAGSRVVVAGGAARPIGVPG